MIDKVNNKNYYSYYTKYQGKSCSTFKNVHAGMMACAYNPNTEAEDLRGISRTNKDSFSRRKVLAQSDTMAYSPFAWILCPNSLNQIEIYHFSAVYYLCHTVPDSTSPL